MEENLQVQKSIKRNLSLNRIRIPKIDFTSITQIQSQQQSNLQQQQQQQQKSINQQKRNQRIQLSTIHQRNIRQQQQQQQYALNKSDERINQMPLSPDIISKSLQLNDSILINHEYEKSLFSPSDNSPIESIKKTSLLSDQIQEQKRNKIKEELMKQIADQEKIIQKLSSKGTSGGVDQGGVLNNIISNKEFNNNNTNNNKVNINNNEQITIGLNLDQFLIRQDTLIQEKRNLIKQKIADINIPKEMMIPRQNNQQQSPKRTNTTLSKLSPRMISPKRQQTQLNKSSLDDSQNSHLIKLKQISGGNASVGGNNKINNIGNTQQFQQNQIQNEQKKQKNIDDFKNSVLISNNNNGDQINEHQESIIVGNERRSIAESMEDQFNQEQINKQSNGQSSQKSKDVYFSSVMEHNFLNQSDIQTPSNINNINNFNNNNQAVIPIRKRIPQISNDQYMNQALAVLIHKTKEQRNSEDIAILMRATKSIPFFNKIESKVLLFQSLCKAMQYQFIPKGGIVFYYGDFPDRFYITLKGKVTILIPKRQEELNREDGVIKDKSQKLTIHLRFLYKSVQRAYKRLTNILYFILIIKVKANILQKIPHYLQLKSKAQFSLNSLPEEIEKNESDHSSINIPQNNSIVFNSEHNNLNKINTARDGIQKSKNDISFFVENEIDKAMKDIKHNNSEKKQLYLQQPKMYQSNGIQQQMQNNSILNSQIYNNKLQQDYKQNMNDQNQIKLKSEENKHDLSDYSINHTPKNKQNNQGIHNSNNNSTINNNSFSLQMQLQQHRNNSVYQPMQPRDSYLVSAQKNMVNIINSSRDIKQQQKDIYYHRIHQEYGLNHKTEENNNTTTTMTDKFKEQLQQRDDQSENSFSQRLDQDSREMKEQQRIPSQLNILSSQNDNNSSGQMKTKKDTFLPRKRSILKIGFESFTNNTNSAHYKQYQEKKKQIESQVKGLDLENLENAAHFFKNNAFKYNHAFTSGDGLVFGELGILNKKPRAATIVCLEDCYFGYLSSLNYQQILMKKEKTSLIQKREFIESTLVQDQLSVEKMSKVSYYFHKRKYQSGEVVFREGDLSQYVYLIKKGEIELQKEEEVFNHETEEISKVTIRVAKLSTREYFGDCDIYFNRKRKFTSIATMQSTIYYCEKGQFLKQLEEIKDFWEIYGEKIKYKEQYRDQLIEESKKTRNYEKNLRKLSHSPHQKMKKKLNQTRQLLNQQQKMDSIICGINGFNNLSPPQSPLLSPKRLHNSISGTLEQLNITKSVQSVQITPRKMIEEFDPVLDENQLMVKSTLYSPRQRIHQLNHKNKQDNILDQHFLLKKTQNQQNQQQIQSQSQQQQQQQLPKQQNYNKEREHNECELNQEFYSPEKIKSLNKQSIDYSNNNGNNLNSYLTLSPQRETKHAENTSTMTINKENSDQIKNNELLPISRLLTPLAKLDFKNNHNDSYKIIDQELQSIQNQNSNISQSLIAGQNTFRSHLNSGFYTNRTNHTNNQTASNNTNNANNNNNNEITDGLLSQQQSQRKERISGQVFQDRQAYIYEQDKVKKEVMQGLKEELFSGTETLKRLRNDIKVNKQILKKGTKHQKKLTAHDQFQLTKDVCMLNDELYQKEEKVNQNKNKIRLIELETGVRKQIHHSKNPSEICSIFSKLSSMDDKITFQNQHALEPELIVVQTPINSRNNSIIQSNNQSKFIIGNNNINNDLPLSHFVSKDLSNNIINNNHLKLQLKLEEKINSLQLEQISSQVSSVQQQKQQQQKQTETNLDLQDNQIIKNSSRIFFGNSYTKLYGDNSNNNNIQNNNLSSRNSQTIIYNNNNKILPEVSGKRETIMKSQNNNNNNSSTSSMIKTSNYFQFQEKGQQNRKLNHNHTNTNTNNTNNNTNNNYNNNIIDGENKYRTLSRKRHLSQNQNTILNYSLSQPQFQSKHKISQSMINKITVQQQFLPIHSEKIINNNNNNNNNSNTNKQSIKEQTTSSNNQFKIINSKDIAQQYKQIKSNKYQIITQTKNNINRSSSPPIQYQTLYNNKNSYKNDSIIQNYKNDIINNNNNNIQKNEQFNNIMKNDQQNKQQQLFFDDSQVEKIAIKRFDLKKNYLTSNKITVLNHMQKPILIKSD